MSFWSLGLSVFCVYKTKNFSLTRTSLIIQKYGPIRQKVDDYVVNQYGTPGLQKNDYVKADINKGLRTLFKPDNGIDYFNEMKAKEGVKD